MTKHFKLPQDVILHTNDMRSLVEIMWNTFTEICEEATRTWHNVFLSNLLKKFIKCTFDKFVHTCTFRHTVAKGDMRCPSEAVQSINATSLINDYSTTPF